MNEITGAALDAAVAAALQLPYKAFRPSDSYGVAMALQIEHGISVICEDTPNLDAKWQAGWSPYTDDWSDTGCRYAAWGPTPQVAICRALVRRAKVQSYTARLEKHNAYWSKLMLDANNRVYATLLSRTPHTEFASDDERKAYQWYMDYASIEGKVDRGELPFSAFDSLPLLPPPFVDLDGTTRYELNDEAGNTSL